ncbi:MAG: PKD domain-containing protein [Thermoanaerobaculia bacterium]|nr:PKD domain-containing protein [Thermoanaerobaculia bacterium]
MSFGSALSWYWDFGDGATDTVQNPTHTYAQSGLYPVTLTIVTADGCQSTVSMEVYAGDYPWTEYDCQAMFLPLPDSTGSGFLFLDLSIANNPIQSWEWQFGDGTSSTEQNPYHTYSQPGVYTVSLTITADSCNSMIAFELDTNDPFHFFRPDGGVLGLAAGASGTDKTPLLEKLTAFPNPATTELMLAFNSREPQGIELCVSNLSGQMVSRQMIDVLQGDNALRIPVQNLTPGLYLLQLRTANQVQTVKFVKG